MQFSIAASVLALAASAAAAAVSNSTVPATVYVTEVATHLTTYCPAATVLTVNSKTYTVTKATTLVSSFSQDH
jgi:hypothetical protein